MTRDRFQSSDLAVRDSTVPRPRRARPSRPLGPDGLAYGGDYNPEQWTRETWVEDVRLMREAGVNLVSIGMFSWASIEPRRGEFHWDWLDEVFALLHGAGIRIDLGTPTAAPPAWFFRAHPESRVVDREGQGPGARVTGHGLPVGPGVPGRGHRHHPRPGRALRRPSRARALARP